MIDIKVVSIRDFLTIHSLTYAKGNIPASLDIVGEKFQRTTEVLINDVKAPEVMVLSSNRVIAQIPAGQERSQIRRVAVLAETPFPGESSLFHFETGPSFRVLKGIERLVQMFCKLLLQTPGSDRFRPTLGGGLLGLVGQNVERNSSNVLAGIVVGAVSRTRDQVLALQSKQFRVPADERLLTAATENAGFDPNNTTLAASVRLSAVSGAQAVANLTF